MLIYKHADLVKTPCKIIMHGCNAQGVMGSGVAKAIREAFPFAYKAYRNKYESEGLQVGNIIVAEQNNKIIVNAITQEFYGYDHKQYLSYAGLVNCFKRLELYIIRNDLEGETIAMPRIGCGLGGGDWDAVSNLIETHLKSFIIEIYDWP